MRKFLLASFIAIFGANNALAETGWSCSNTQMQITCHDDSCEVENEAFTPTGLSVDPIEMSYCAYSGCWKGKPTILSTAETFYAVGLDLLWNYPESDWRETVQIAIDTKTGQGTVLAAGFVMPMTCEPWKCGEDCLAGRGD